MRNALAAQTTPDIVILAGGTGKRMRVGHPKALHQVFFRPMIHYVLDIAMATPHRKIYLIVGRGERELREQCRGYSEIIIIRQETPLGTANALRPIEAIMQSINSNILILNGDAVLITPHSLQELIAKHVETGAGCTVGIATSGDSAIYCFRGPDLFSALKQITLPKTESELSLENMLTKLVETGAKISKYIFSDPVETMDINEQHGLWRVEKILQERFNRELMLKGVAVQDPHTTLIDPRCRIDQDVRIEGGCTIINSILEAGVLVENFCRIVNSRIGINTQLKQGTSMDESRIGRDCRVGPYARLRAGAYLEDDVWIGNFVEIKNSNIGTGTRAAHLSFIGDAQVGRDVNIGCGFITCNSAGKPLKQRTIIEDKVFIGSASQAIAPVTLGAGSFIATGTTITENVPPDCFVISRGRQITKPGYSKKSGKLKRMIPSP